MKNNTSYSKAFTLIELLVVIAIIGILSSVVLASLSGARESAQVTRTVSDFNQIETAMAMWMQSTGRTKWPHPANDLGISGGSNYVSFETLSEETNLNDYLTSVPKPSFGDQYRYTIYDDTFTCGDGRWHGVNIQITNAPVNEVGADVKQIIEGEGDSESECGKVRYNSDESSGYLYYSLSNDRSF